jgi:hypothetical protein
MDAYDEPGVQCGICCAAVLVPVVFVCLLLEVIWGSGIAWGYISEQPRNYWGIVAGFFATVIGPAVLVFATLRTRSMREHMARRVMRIEVWTLIATLPFALLCLLAIMAAAVI